MHDLKWDDLYITPQEFIDIFTVAAQDSMYFQNSWDRPCHPEDLFYNMDSVMEGVGNGLIRYLSLIGPKVRARQLKQERESRTQVFGGTIPTSELSENIPASGPVYASNNIFGDNV